tara:strand:+ start:386 stop:1345 length:960 start_codon:yes stop_codon:yes gene_type:complete
MNSEKLIKVFFCCSWDPNTIHFLTDKYLPLTPKSSGIWKNIIAIDNIYNADWVVIIDDIHSTQLNDILQFDKNKIICIPREPNKTNIGYLNYNFKYKFVYENFFHCWSSIMCIKKTYDDLINMKNLSEKTKLCSSITSKFGYNSNIGIYKNRVNFIKKLSEQKSFLDKIDIFGYSWTEKELGKMYKGTFGGFNIGTCEKIDKLIPNTSKWDGLKHYSYSIAIENCCKENYFSEKFTDCILAYTIPIYYGCPNINKYFSKDCYYWLDINSPNCFNELENILNTPITDKQINAMKIARDKILNKYNVWNIVNNIIINDKNI